jgi:hypothetical protein
MSEAMGEDQPLRISGTEAERLLLAAGSADRPDASSVRKAAERLGLFPGPLVVLAALALVLRGAKWTSIVARGLVSLAGVAAVVAAVHALGGTTGVAPNAAGPGGEAASGRVGGPTARTVAASPPASEVAADVAAVTESAPPARPGARGQPIAPKKTARATAPIEASAEPADSLGAQAERLDRARARVEAGDSNGALAALDDYDRRFAGGVLSEESSLLRIEALRRRGDTGAAKALARRFLRMYPASVHVGRVTALLHSLSP